MIFYIIFVLLARVFNTKIHTQTQMLCCTFELSESTANKEQKNSQPTNADWEFELLLIDDTRSFV